MGRSVSLLGIRYSCGEIVGRVPDSSPEYWRICFPAPSIWSVGRSLVTRQRSNKSSGPKRGSGQKRDQTEKRRTKSLIKYRFHLSDPVDDDLIRRISEAHSKAILLGPKSSLNKTPRR